MATVSSDAAERAVNTTGGDDLRKKISAAISDPGYTEGYKGDRTLTEWQTDAVLRVLGQTPPPQPNLEGDELEERLAEAEWEAYQRARNQAHALNLTISATDLLSLVRAAADAPVSNVRSSFQKAFPEGEGIGATYQRETDSWRLYVTTVKGVEGFGSIDGYNKARMDWIIAALRAAIPAPQSREVGS